MTLPRALLIAATLACVAAPAGAQVPDSNVFFNAPGLLPKKPKPGPPEVKAQPAVWPRLDPGAIFCRSADDLRRLAARRGGEAVQGPIDCQVIRVPTGIAILEREGPGMVQVKTNDPAAGGVGWTDAWLPSREPGVRASASAGR